MSKPAEEVLVALLVAASDAGLSGSLLECAEKAGIGADLKDWSDKAGVGAKYEPGAVAPITAELDAAKQQIAAATQQIASLKAAPPAPAPAMGHVASYQQAGRAPSYQQTGGAYAAPGQTYAAPGQTYAGGAANSPLARDRVAPPAVQMKQTGSKEDVKQLLSTLNIIGKDVPNIPGNDPQSLGLQPEPVPMNAVAELTDVTSKLVTVGKTLEPSSPTVSAAAEGLPPSGADDQFVRESVIKEKLRTVAALNQH